MDDAGLTTENMVEDARKMLEDFKECHRSMPTWLTKYNIMQGKFKLDLLLTAMLDFAPMSGGPERGQGSLRYVAAAICACSGPRRESDETANALSALAMTWFARFLWTFRMHSSYKKYSNEANPSGQATPTSVETSGFMFDAVGHRNSTMATKVFKRQRQFCPITGVGSRVHFDNNDDTDFLCADMENSHIFKRAAAEFNLDNPIDSCRYAMTTWDIIRNYMALTDEEMEAIVPTIDDPISSSPSTVTEIPNEYTIQLHHPKFRHVFPVLPVGGREHRVVFKDYSNSDPPIPLPNTAYLRLHAAIAGILSMSGAGEVMDEFEDKHGKPALIYWGSQTTISKTLCLGLT
ncbi:hypothetical protein ARMGADRAFT_1074881 [Armillaria gallica]|uniref:HNH nuclease domain-containing protein n=1 Tax=Armillaria gallica TaxID=47427 RepID=A0A2H3DY02_ARMGA|nr:hypothetical protein ARMGADRAFT_1074881 [Armillaria gallica]